MDVLLLGAAAVVLIALTVWIVWRAPTEAPHPEDSAAMIPQGDQFEDQYTSATADLSAGGVALAGATADEDDLAATRAETTTSQPVSQGEPLAGQRMGRNPPAQRPARAQVTYPPQPIGAEPLPAQTKPAQKIGLGAAAALTLGGAAAGAWLYARWQRERSKQLNRLRRRFR